MARPTESSAKRPRTSLDVHPEVRRRLRPAAAKLDLTTRKHVLDATEDRLRESPGDSSKAVFALGAKADPEVAELWHCRRDAAHDRHSSVRI